jgi:tripartite-type tricarboxylate transporter receptor subunit TctC
MRKLLSLALLAIVAAMVSIPPVLAQQYPNKPIRLILNVPPGGGSDVLARAILPELEKALGGKIFIDYHGGANGVIGTLELTKARPDGYTLLLTFPSHVTNVLLMPTLPYDTFKDFAPVSLVATSPFILLGHPSLQANTVPELIAYAKTHPGEINVGLPNRGSPQHLAHELMNFKVGIKMNLVTYKGGGPMMTDLLGGHVSLAFGSLAFATPYLKGNRLKALAVSSKIRLDTLPNVPTIGETIPGFEASIWFGVIAPAGTPEPIIRKLADAIGRVVRSPEMNAKLIAQGTEPVGSTPEEFGAFIANDFQKWSALVKQAGVTAE